MPTETLNDTLNRLAPEQHVHLRTTAAETHIGRILCIHRGEPSIRDSSLYLQRDDRFRGAHCEEHGHPSQPSYYIPFGYISEARIDEDASAEDDEILEQSIKYTTLGIPLKKLPHNIAFCKKCHDLIRLGEQHVCLK